MKKNLLVLFVLAMAALPGYCVLSTEEALSPSYITNHGYSPEMARLVDLQNSQINNTPITYKQQYKPRWFAPYLTNQKVKTVVNYLDPQQEQGKYTKAIFDYFDPSLDDGKFMQNKIEFGSNPEDL